MSGFLLYFCNTLCFASLTSSCVHHARPQVLFRSTKTGAGFNNLSFYQQIVSTFESWAEGEQRSLIVWWNRCAACHSWIMLFPGMLADAKTTVWCSHTFVAELTRGHSTTLLHPVPRQPSCCNKPGHPECQSAIQVYWVRFSSVPSFAIKCTVVYAINVIGFI